MKKGSAQNKILSLQKAFASDIRNGKTKLSSKIIPGGKLSAKKVIEVYQQGYIARLTDAISANYEAVWFALGDKKFFKLCSDYRAAHPSMTYNLNTYGHQLPAFIARKFSRLPYLHHLARFEWLLFEVFNAPEQPSSADLGKVNAEKDVLVFQPAVKLFSSPFRTYDIWKNRKHLPKGYVPKNFTSDEYVLIYKHEHRHYFSVLTHGQFVIMRLLLKGKTISQAIISAGKSTEISEQEVAHLFSLIAAPGVAQSVKSSSGAPKADKSIFTPLGLPALAHDPE